MTVAVKISPDNPSASEAEQSRVWVPSPVRLSGSVTLAPLRLLALTSVASVKLSPQKMTATPEPASLAVTVPVTGPLVNQPLAGAAGRLKVIQGAVVSMRTVVVLAELLLPAASAAVQLMTCVPSPLA